MRLVPSLHGLLLRHPTAIPTFKRFPFISSTLCLVSKELAIWLGLQVTHVAEDFYWEQRLEERPLMAKAFSMRTVIAICWQPLYRTA